MAESRGGVFTGELGLVNLFDVSQLLVLNRATGVLAVTAGKRTGYLYFENGRLANAVDDEQLEGENAAYRVYAWRTGRFEFRAEPANGKHLIEQSTEAVMLESARRMDESAPTESSEGTASETRQTERLRETQNSLEALRDVFKSLARETGEAIAGGGVSVSRLFGIGAPDDRVVLRAGHPTHVRVNGVWATFSERPLSREDYQQLFAELVAGSLPEGPDPSVSRHRRLLLANGAMVRLTIVDEAGAEAIWVRPITVAAPAPGTLVVDRAALEALLDRFDGLVLVTAAEASDARRALHALIAARDQRHQDVTLVLGSEPVYRHAASRGTVMQLAPAEAVSRLSVVEPQLLALEPDVAPTVLADAAAQTPCWWVAVTGPDPASAACRWALRATAPPQSLPTLGILPVTLANATLDADGRITLRIVALGETERAQWLSGDAAGLFAALEQPGGRPALKVVNGGR